MSKTEKIVNKCPHAVYIMSEDKTVLKVFPKSNGMMRVKEIVKDKGMIAGIPICSTEWGETSAVPEYVEGTYYIVSQLVKNALPHRKDLLVPKGVIRDDEGNIVGCTRLDIGYQKN